MGYLEYVASFNGLDSVDAIGSLDVSASLFSSLFSYQFDVSYATDICANTMKMGVNSSSIDIFNDISLSHTILKSGQICADYVDQHIYKDAIRRISYQFTGAHSAADIFTNEEEMVTIVRESDISFADGFNGILSNVSNLGLKTRAQYSSLTDLNAKGLYTICDKLLCFTIDSNVDNTAGYQILQSAMTQAYQNNGNSFPININFGFSAGQYVGVRMSYEPNPDNPNCFQFDPISYKCLLRLT